MKICPKLQKSTTDRSFFRNLPSRNEMVDRNDGKFNGNKFANNDVKLGTELKPQIIFVFAIKIGKNTTIILEYIFS